MPGRRAKRGLGHAYGRALEADGGCGVKAGLGVVVARCWPAYVTRFIYQGRFKFGRLPLRGGWGAPGLLTAWRMSGRPGATVACTLPVVANAIVVVGGALCLTYGPPETAAVGGVLLHAVALPWFTWLAVDRAAVLRLPELPWSEHGPAPER